MAVGWCFGPCRQFQVTGGGHEERALAPSSHSQPPTRLFSSFPQSQGLRARGSRTASPQQSRPLLGAKAIVMDVRVAVAPISRGWSSWGMVCTTSPMGWP